MSEYVLSIRDSNLHILEMKECAGLEEMVPHPKDGEVCELADAGPVQVGSSARAKERLKHMKYLCGIYKRVSTEEDSVAVLSSRRQEMQNNRIKYSMRVDDYPIRNLLE